MENTAFLKKSIDAASKVCILVHTHPDGDAAGSGLAMLSYLCEKLGKNAFLVVPDSIPSTLAFMDGVHQAVDASAEPDKAAEIISTADLLLIQDLNRLNRTEQLEAAVRSSGATKVLIDHHMNPDREAFDIVFSEPERSSTCELLYFILRELEGGAVNTLPARCLSSLMTGMITDTNNFANSVRPDTLRMAAELLEAGVDRDGILQHLYNEDRRERIFAFADMVSSRTVILPCGLSYMIMTEEMENGYGLLEGETESLVNIPLKIKDVKMNVFLREEGGLFRVSIRSRRGWSARKMAETLFHGGGHELAAGGKLRWPDDIPAREAAEDFIRTVAARFLRETTTL